MRIELTMLNLYANGKSMFAKFNQCLDRVSWSGELHKGWIIFT